MDSWRVFLFFRWKSNTTIVYFSTQLFQLYYMRSSFSWPLLWAFLSGPALLTWFHISFEYFLTFWHHGVQAHLTFSLPQSLNQPFSQDLRIPFPGVSFTGEWWQDWEVNIGMLSLLVVTGSRGWRYCFWALSADIIAKTREILDFLGGLVVKNSASARATDINSGPGRCVPWDS